MLKTLFGSKSAERVLLYLLLNEYSYAGEIQKSLQIPLTPLQSILRKLEKADILSHASQGKKRLYRFNPSYPLLEELKALLKKGFLYLSPEEKKTFFLKKESPSLPSFDRQKRSALCLNAFWSRLLRAQTVSIQAKPSAQAFGMVTVKEEKTNTLLFTEKGQWLDPEISFTNQLRWTFDFDAQTIALEHLRYGSNRPVFLFHLSPVGPKTLQSIDSHLCREDHYFGRIEFTTQHIRFLWRILGPHKNESLFYTYS